MKKLFLVLVIYLFVFSPPLMFIPFSISNILALFSIIYLAFQKSWGELAFKFRREFLLLIITFLYLFVRFLYSGRYDYEPLVGAYKMLFVSFPIGLFIISYAKNNDIEQRDFLKLALIPFIVAGSISIFLILNPGINEFVKSHILRLSETALSLSGFYVRGFGLSDSLLYGYPIALSLGICLMSEISKNKFWILLVSLILLLPIFFNARIGLIPFMIYLAYSVFVKRNIQSFLLIATFFTVVYLALDWMGIIEQYASIKNWVLSSFLDTSALLSDSSNAGGNYGVLADMFQIPKNLVFGSGKYIYAKGLNSSDIGFILQLNYGGIIYVLLILLFMLKITIRSFLKLGFTHWFPIVVTLTMFVVNIKGNFFAANPGFNTILLLYFAYLLLDDTEVEPTLT